MKSILIFILISSFVLNAQTADEVIKKVQTKFDSIENISANFNQVISSLHSSKSIIVKGKFYFQKEKSFRIELPNRMIISDGKTVWNFDENQNKVVISEAVTDEISFSLNEIIYDYPNKCDLELLNSDSTTFTIKATPKDANLSFKEAMLTISNNFILNKIVIIDFNNMKYSFELLSIKLNKKLNRTLFESSPTNEVEIIDLR